MIKGILQEKPMTGARVIFIHLVHVQLFWIVIQKITGQKSDLHQYQLHSHHHLAQIPSVICAISNEGDLLRQHIT